MRLLLDECVPRQLKRHFTEYAVRTVQEVGWSGLKYGALLLRAAESFDAVLTVDRGLDVSLHQSGAAVGVVLIVAPRTDLPFLVPHVEAAKAALARIQRGEFIAVNSRVDG